MDRIPFTCLEWLGYMPTRHWHIQLVAADNYTLDTGEKAPASKGMRVYRRAAPRDVPPKSATGQGGSSGKTTDGMTKYIPKDGIVMSWELGARDFLHDLLWRGQIPDKYDSEDTSNRTIKREPPFFIGKVHLNENNIFHLPQVIAEAHGPSQSSENGLTKFLLKHRSLVCQVGAIFTAAAMDGHSQRP
jgi:hypothetical protein